MILKEYNLSVRLPQERAIDTGITLVQNDKDVYKLNIRIFDGVNEIDYSEVDSATITFLKRDNNVVQGNMAVEADQLSYTLGTNEIACPGKVLVSIQLFGATERLSTARFVMSVERDLVTADAVQSTSEFPILQQLKQDLEAIDVVALTSAFNAHTADYASLIDNPTMHRNIFRGKNLGTSLTTEQKTNIQNGTFKGLFLGDYWVIGGRNWRIVDFNYWYNCGDTAFTNNHLVVMPDTALYTAQMNAENVTTGGYVGSEMYTTNLEEAKTIVNSAFGSAVLTHREYLTNAVTNGYPSGGAWFDSNVELPNEIMIYGSLIFTPVGNGSIVVNRHTISKTQLALFTVAPKFANIRATYWLRDVVSASYFALVDYIGRAHFSRASSAFGVRPVFPIG